jgi:hypothetical protein
MTGRGGSRGDFSLLPLPSGDEAAPRAALGDSENARSAFVYPYSIFSLLPPNEHGRNRWRFGTGTEGSPLANIAKGGPVSGGNTPGVPK